MNLYEKEYKEALEKARQLCAYPTSKPFISDLQDIFPQLKESEDDRIKKEITELVMQPTWKTEKEFHQRNELCAWLEKHKYTEDDLDKAYKCADEVQYRRGYEDDKKEIVKQEWSEEDEKIIGSIRRIIAQDAFYNDAVDVNGELCEKMYIDADNWLKSLKDKYTWKPTNEQMKALDDVISSRDIKYDVLSELWNDLKKLKE